MIEDKLNWYPMWEELGIDIDKHDQLLAVLPDIYKSIYIETQKDRPDNMAFFDFVVGDIHGLRIKELKEEKKEGKIIVGTYCLYIPDEIIYALNTMAPVYFTVFLKNFRGWFNFSVFQQCGLINRFKVTFFNCLNSLNYQSGSFFHQPVM